MNADVQLDVRIRRLQRSDVVLREAHAHTVRKQSLTSRRASLTHLVVCGEGCAVGDEHADQLSVAQLASQVERRAPLSILGVHRRAAPQQQVRRIPMARVAGHMQRSPAAGARLPHVCALRKQKLQHLCAPMPRGSVQRRQRLR